MSGRWKAVGLVVGLLLGACGAPAEPSPGPSGGFSLAGSDADPSPHADSGAPGVPSPAASGGFSDGGSLAGGAGGAGVCEGADGVYGGHVCDLVHGRAAVAGAGAEGGSLHHAAGEGVLAAGRGWVGVVRAGGGAAHVGGAGGADGVLHAGAFGGGSKGGFFGLSGGVAVPGRPLPLREAIGRNRPIASVARGAVPAGSLAEDRGDLPTGSWDRRGSDGDPIQDHGERRDR
jgi:hypothetical protein